jgi:dTDP-4-amino-4,6-dideoxygalactose transaminase
MKWLKHGVVWTPPGTQWWARTHATCPTPIWLDDQTLRVYVQCRDEHNVGRIGFVDLDPSDPRKVGSSIKYQHDVAGVNSRLDEMQSAVLRIKLQHLDADNARGAAVADHYREALAETPVALVRVPDGAQSVWHLFVVRTSRRDALRDYLTSRGIGTQIHYPVPCHRQEAFADQAWPELPATERLQSQILSLPMSPYLSADDVAYVAAQVKAFFG